MPYKCYCKSGNILYFSGVAADAIHSGLVRNVPADIVNALAVQLAQSNWKAHGKEHIIRAEWITEEENDARIARRNAAIAQRK